MIELAGGLGRLAHVASGCILLGLLVFRLCVDRSDRQRDRSGPFDWVNAALALDSAFLLSAIAVFAAQLGTVAGTPGVADPAEWVRYALDTRFGLAWMVQHAIALVLLVLLAARTRLVATMGRQRHLVSCAALATLAVPMSALAGHGAGGDAAIAVPVQWLHILAAGCWLGGLPVLLARSRHAARNRTEAACALVALRRFSVMAGGAMLCLVVTGALSASLQVAGLAPLLGTSYGHLLLLKLSLLAAILIIAAHIRWRLLPRATPTGSLVGERLPLLLGLELMLALGLVAVASRLADTVPAIHDQIVWPLPVRWAPEATWSLPGVSEQVVAGLALALAGAGGGLACIGRSARGRWLVAASVVIAGLWVAVSPLTVEAGRDTYRRSSTAYDATSIAAGERLFRGSCAACHGTGAMGDGSAASPPRPRADLTAPHVRDHTAGDMFAWISNGIAAGGMPAFADLLAEDERWDLVNFVHAVSIGYQARILRETIVPKAPWVAAPDFAFVTASGAAVALQDFRERAVVLLVLFALPESEPRLRELRRSAAALAAAGVAVIAVPIDPEAEADPAVIPGAMPAARTGNEIVGAYMLFRRTLINQRAGEVGPRPRHMEFLIDRYGFLRARWLPEDNSSGWDDVTVLLDQARALTSEGRVRAPPDAHLH